MIRNRMLTKVIFVGGTWNKNEDSMINKNSNGAVQNAANILQHSIIRGMDELLDDPVTILSMKFIGSFPFLYKKMYINSFTFNHSECTEHIDYNIGFLNLPIVKHYSKTIEARKYIKKTCKRSSNEKIYVIGYSMTYSVTKTLRYVKKVNPYAVTCLIIPDLPEYMNPNNKRSMSLFYFLKSYSNKVVYRDIKDIDTYVLLTKQMYSRLDSPHPYVVVEGIAPYQSKDYLECKDKLKRIVYTGGMTIRYGVCDLVDAFCKIVGDEFRLVLCGIGDAEKYIEKKSKIDSRIEFLGEVDNDKARKIQRSAYILVNPRKGNGGYTKYSFPSKTMEYMISGRPVVMYKLEGIPDEYDEYLYYVNESLEKTLQEVLNISAEELSNKGNKAREFVIKEKNSNAQAKKILNMLFEQNYK